MSMLLNRIVDQRMLMGFVKTLVHTHLLVILMLMG